MAKKEKKALRTSKGSPTAYAREKYGIGGTGAYPVFDKESCVSAVKLRHHGSIPASRVLSHAARSGLCPEAVKRAREADKKRKKK
jgi:hypothetical protein